MHFPFLILLLAISSVKCVRGSLIAPGLNPGCSECSPQENILVYIKVNTDEIIHQVWDFTGPHPSIMYIIGNDNSTLNVLWDGNKPTQIATNNTSYSFSLILNNLIEYNDTHDRGYFDYTDKHREIPLRDVSWRLLQKVLTGSQVKVKMRGTLTHEKHGTTGTVDVKLSLVPRDGRSVSLPRLLHSIRSTEVEVGLVDLSVSPLYSASRFALRYALLSEDGAGEELVREVKKSVDDEYTPGVFETINMMTPLREERCGGYIQFRPVAYTEYWPDVSSSVPAYMKNYTKVEVPHCLAQHYYEKFNKEMFKQELVASFGLNGDGFYEQTNYTIWTYVLGYGTPPVDQKSAFTKATIWIGVVLPGLLIICTVALLKAMPRRPRSIVLQEGEP